MTRTSTFRMAIWIMIVIGSALSVKTLRRNANRPLASLTTLTRKASVEAVRISGLTLTLFLP